jgi:hypothetical protein
VFKTTSMDVYTRYRDMVNAQEVRSMERAIKFDVGKLRYDLVPARALEEVVEVFSIGAEKYAARDWEKGLEWGRVFAAMMRHAWAWWRGQARDPEGQQHHLASVAWAAFVLMTYERTHPELDDRPKELL